MKIAIANSRTEITWQNVDWSEEKLLAKLRSPVRTPETLSAFMEMSKSQQGEIKDKGGFVGGHLRDGQRRKGGVLLRSLLSLDLDSGRPDTLARLKGLPYRCFVHTTHKHTPEKPRFRLIIPLSREISEEEYPAVARRIAADIGIELFDDSTYEANRMMFWPTVSCDGEYIFEVIEGQPLEPDAVLSQYKNWRNTEEWPVSARQDPVVLRQAAKVADPLTKDGAVGLICRAYYPIQLLLEEHLSDIYEPLKEGSRYTYTKGSTSGGLVVYEDKFVYSHHDSDPAAHQLLNAFDLWRIHAFGKLDVGTTKKGPNSPSFKAMLEHALQDERVNMQRCLEFKEKIQEAAQEYGLEVSNDEGTSWLSKLEYDLLGINILSTLNNANTILRNDPLLKNIAYDQLTQAIVLTGVVPWDRQGERLWNDADDDYLLSYLHKNYAKISKQHMLSALTTSARDKGFHPIREYLNTLPIWDGVPRVDTLFIDYFGEEDTPYVRAVARKILCAAIKRALEPGCKFDTMVVLKGPQGTGKSTLISKLGGTWYTDNLTLADTRDKTGAEKLMGIWIVEISELAGRNKAEEESIRSFITRTDDKFREAYGRRVISHPRQCVFFATTNAQNGFLRDITGNRRYWPINAPGTGHKKSWDMTDDDVRQIWAEAKHYFQAGESLCLPPNLQEEACARQRQELETDELEGVILDYLDTPIPLEWSQMDLPQRLNFLQNENSGPGIQRTGAERRTEISPIEIWCECFKKNKADYNGKTDGRRIITVLLKNHWTRGKKRRVPFYGPQNVFKRNV